MSTVDVKKIYVVVRLDYDGKENVCAFSNEDDAENYIDEYAEEGASYDIDELTLDFPLD